MRSSAVAFAWAAMTAFGAVGCARAAASTTKPEDESQSSSGFAVVELFTSEGCSSCPPADDVLRDLAAEAARTGRRVYPLAFHVDYWDSLGWPDPFASPSWTDRQHVYAPLLGQQGVYTPQMIVNGHDAFVGSDASRARKSIDTARRMAPDTKVQLHPVTRNGEVSVEFTVDGAPSGAVLQLALVQRDAETHVRSGENAGRTLHHANVVRGFRTVPLDKDATGRAAFVKNPGTGASAVIGYVQDPETMAIVGASQAPL